MFDLLQKYSYILKFEQGLSDIQWLPQSWKVICREAWFNVVHLDLRAVCFLVPLSSAAYSWGGPWNQSDRLMANSRIPVDQFAIPPGLILQNMQQHFKNHQWNCCDRRWSQRLSFLLNDYSTLWLCAVQKEGPTEGQNAHLSWSLSILRHCSQPASRGCCWRSGFLDVCGTKSDVNHIQIYRIYYGIIY